MATTTTPVVFIHGLWLHADSWSPWADLFREHGYEPVAPGWPGDGGTVEETRSAFERVAGHGIDAVVDEYARAIDVLARAWRRMPIVIGHSFGGLIVQRLLAENKAVAGVALDPAPIKGVLYLPPSALRVASVALRNPANRNRAVSLTREQFRYGFGNAVSEQESDELYERWTIPSPGKPLFEAAVANFNPHSAAKIDTSNADRGPLLLTAGGKDHTVPPTIVRATLKRQQKSGAITELKEFPDRGHSLGIDSGWREVAETVLAWLGKQDLR